LYLVLRRPPLSSFVSAFGAALLVAPIAHGSGVTGATRVVQSVFFIAKSENKNQVHYGIRLDEQCAPVGETPVFAYWRMLEHGPLATEPLLPRELRAYGLARQSAERGPLGGRVSVTLNAMPKRAIVIESAPGEGTCTAVAKAVINGIPATLTSVFVQLRWPFGVDHLEIAGHAITDGRFVRERVSE
jgi:hypothetical protein